MPCWTMSLRDCILGSVARANRTRESGRRHGVAARQQNATGKSKPLPGRPMMVW
jgi:hypothetical protein